MQRVLTCGFTAQFSIIIEAITAESNGITHYKKKETKPICPQGSGLCDHRACNGLRFELLNRQLRAVQMKLAPSRVILFCP